MRNQGELSGFLTKDIAYFERSTFGATIEAIIAGAYLSRKCLRCDGLGILDEPHTITHTIDHFTRERTELGERLADGRWLAKPVHASTGKDCPRCQGTGYVPSRRDDHENTSMKHQTVTKEAPPDALLMRYAAVSRRLIRMPSLLAAALVAAFGDEGESLAETSRGRAWAAAPLTDAGKKLLEHLRATSRKDDLNPWRAVSALTDLARIDAAHPLPKRTELLALASIEAAALVTEAVTAWEGLIDG
jgi:hypothetical protein